MTDQELRSVIRAVLEEERASHSDTIALQTVATILKSFGIEEKDQIEIQADFRHLRRWRKSVEQAQSLTFKIAFTAIVTGILGAIWMGFKAMLGK